MYLLIFFLAFLILNLAAGIYFAVEWETERKKSGAPAVVYIVLAAVATLIFLLSLPYISKVLLSFLDLGFKELLVYSYLAAMLALSIVMVSDWSRDRDSKFYKSWRMMAFIVLPAVMLFITSGIIYYAYKQGKKELIFS